MMQARESVLVQQLTIQSGEAQRQLAAEREGRARAEAEARQAMGRAQDAEVTAPLYACKLPPQDGICPHPDNSDDFPLDVRWFRVQRVGPSRRD